MAHNGAPTSNPEEAAAAQAAALAEQLKEAAANKEIKMTYLNGAEGESQVMVPSDAKSQKLWVESSFNTGLTETQREHLKPEAQEAYSDWLATREAKEARNARVEADAEVMADDARKQVEGLFGEGGSGSGKVPTEKEGKAKPIGEQLQTEEPVKRGFDKLAVPLDEAVERGNQRKGSGHELVPRDDVHQPAPKVVEPRRRPSPRPRTEGKTAEEAARDRTIAHNDRVADTQEEIANRRRPKPVTNVQSEAGDGKKVAEIIGNALGGKPTEPAHSPVDRRPTDELPRPEVPETKSARTEADATDTQRIPESTIKAAEQAAAQPAASEQPAVTPQPQPRTKPSPRPHERAGEPAQEAQSAIIRETVDALDPRKTHQLGFKMADAVAKGDNDGILKAGKELDEYLSAIGVDERMRRIAKDGIITQGDMYLLASQQADAVAAGKKGVAKATEAALLEKLAELTPNAPAEQVQEIAQRMLAESVRLRQDVRNERFTELTVKALASKPGTPERDTAVQRMRDYAAAEASNMSGPQREVLIAESLARGEAAQAAAAPKPEAPEPEWPTLEDTDRIEGKKIDDLDRESQPSEKLDNIADHYVSARVAAGNDSKDPRVVAARKRVEQTLVDQYRGESNDQLAERAEDLVNAAYDRYDRAQSQLAAEQTGRVPRAAIDDADKAGNQQSPTPEQQDRARIMGNRELARRIADIPATPDNMDELVHAQADLRQHLATTNPELDRGQIEDLADQLERKADQEAAIADLAYANYYDQSPAGNAARDRLFQYVQNDPRFKDALQVEQLEEYDRLLRRAQYRALRRTTGADTDDPYNISGPDPGAGGGTHQNTGTNPNANAGGTGRYEHYDRLLERLTEYNNAEANEDGAKLSAKERIKLLEDLEAYRETPGIKPSDALAATETFERIFQTLSDRQQRKYWDREVPPEAAADPEGNWFKRTGKAIFHAPLTKQERLILRQRRKMDIDANGDSEMDYYGDLSGPPEGGFNEGDRPLQSPAERQVGRVLWQAGQAINDPHLTQADRDAIANYAQRLEGNYRNFDWNQLTGDQRPVGFLPRALWRPSRRRAGADEVGPVDELSGLIQGAVDRAYGTRGPQNNRSPRGPRAGRPGPAGPSGRRFRPRSGAQPPVQPPVPPQGPPRPGRPTPFPRPQQAPPNPPTPPFQPPR